MPLPKGTKYRVSTTQTGKKIRLAFSSKGKVIEAKNMDTGATHTPAEFRVDAKKKLKKRSTSNGHMVSH